jgi:kynurenine formamidase
MQSYSIAACALALLAAPAFADDWHPSPFGADDQAGRSNLMTPEVALDAISLMQTGTVVSLGRVMEAEMPLFGARAFALRGTGGLAGGPLADNNVIWMDDFLATEIGQVGTQFDGLGHIGIGGESNKFYNGLDASEVVGSYGLQKLGIEQVKPFFTRGILIDVAGLEGRMLDAGEEISVAQIEAALERQGMSADVITEGSMVAIHTGWGSLWIEDNDRFNSGCPGIGIEAGEWLAEKGVAVVGADTWPVEVVPNPDPSQAFPVHQIFIPKNGIFIHENLATERLAEAGVYQFAYIYSPVPIKGATGSPGAPLAVY